MGTTVDNRVVGLGFDNKQFEAGTKASIASLDKLKQALNLDAAAKNLSNLTASGKNFNLSGIADNVQKLSDRFSTLGIIGMTVIQNLANAALDYGKKIAAGLLDPITKGLNEYETQINAVQTILANTASKGTTIDQVNASLDQLNEYSDKTIYNFTEMAKNIGTFTAAGVELDTSVSAIKGIANLAAVSGSSSQQASVAMYQLSQAISSGTVRLMDWNSVQNAGMGGEVFKNSLLETARVHGVAVDAMIEKNGSFRDSLQEGWLTSDILLETLGKFTGDLTEEQLRSIGYTEEQIAGIVKLGETAKDAATKVKTFTQLKDTIQEALVSGWSQSWRIIIGDFEEARAFFTEVSDTIGPLIQASSDARNKVLQDWADLGGRSQAIDALRNVFEALMAVVRPIGEALRSVFGEGLSGKDLYYITTLLRNFTEGLIISGDTAEKIKTIFIGLFSGLDIVRQVIVNLIGAFFSLGGAIDAPKVSILDFLTNIATYLTNLRNAIDINKGFAIAIEYIKNVIATASDYVSNLATNIQNFLAPALAWLTELFNKIDLGGFVKNIGLIVTNFKSMNTSFSGLQVGGGIFSAILDKIIERFEMFKNGAKNVIDFLGKIGSKVQQASPFFEKIGEAIQGFFDNIGPKIKEAIQNIDYNSISDAFNIGLLAVLGVTVKKFIDSGSGFIDSAGGIFKSITGILDGVRGSLEAWQASLKAKTLLMIAGAVAILAASLVVLSFIDSQKLTTATLAISAMFVELAAFSKLAGTGAGALGLIGLSTSILIIALAVTQLSKIKPEGIQQALMTIGALTAGLVVVNRVMTKDSGKMLSGSVGLIAFAISLLTLAKVIKKLGNLDPKELTIGLAAMGAILLEMAIFTRLVDTNALGMTKSAGIILLALSILIFAEAVYKLANLDQAKIKQGLIALGVIFAELGLFTKLAGGATNMISIGVSMAIIAGSMLIFAQVLTAIGGMDMAKLQQGLIGMGVALLSIAIAANIMPKDMLIKAAGLAIMAAALMLIYKVLSAMGTMKWSELAVGLTALGGSLLIITLALYAMQGTIGGAAALLLVAVALTVLVPVLQVLGSMSLAEIGAALLVLAGVFLILGLAGYLLAPVVPVLFLLAGAIMLLSVAAVLVGVGLLAFSTGLAALAATGGAAALVVVAMVTALLGLVPVIISTLINALIQFAQGIVTATPVIFKAISAILNGFIDLIVEFTPKIFNVLRMLLDMLIKLIRDVVPDFVSAVLDLLLELLKQIAARVPEFVQAGFDILIGFLQGIRDNIGEVVITVGEIVVEFLNAVATELPKIIDAGWNLMIEFINGMADSVDKNLQPLIDAITRLGGNIITGLATAIYNGASSILKALGDIVDAAIQAIKEKLGIASPSKVFAKIATFIPLGIVVGIKKMASKVIAAMKDLGDDAIGGLKETITRINDMINGNIDMSPTITPVIDLSKIKAGGAELEGLLANKTLSLVPAVSRTASISGNMVQSRVPESAQINPTSTVSFVQNNYSPTALSRLEIYRQTRNQLTALKGLGK